MLLLCYNTDTNVSMLLLCYNTDTNVSMCCATADVARLLVFICYDHVIVFCWVIKGDIIGLSW